MPGALPSKPSPMPKLAAIFVLTVLLFFTLSLIPPPSLAADTQSPALFGKSKDPVDIVSDALDFDQKQQIATFTGNVTAHQADTTLHCDTLKIYFTKPGNKLKEIVATGKKVVINLQQKKGICRKMHYYDNERKIVLSGNPSLDDGKNIITGETIIFYIDEKRSVVKSGRNKRVKTTIFPGQKNGLGWQ